LGGGVGVDLDEPVAFVVGVVEAAGAGGGFEAGGEAEAAGDGQGGEGLFQAPAGGVEAPGGLAFRGAVFDEPVFFVVGVGFGSAAGVAAVAGEAGALGEVAVEGGFEGRGLFVGAEGFAEVRLGSVAVAVVGVLDVGVISSLALYRSGKTAHLHMWFHY
jgi:hypothetical protein